MPYPVPLRANPQRQRVAKPLKLGAPVKGWYTASSIAAAPEDTAIIMENWFCEPDAVHVRKGAQSHATGLSGNPVESLVIHTDGTATRMFGIAGSSAYEVTAGGAAGAAVLTGLSNSRFQYVNFSTPGGAFLVMCNGADDVIRYDGSTWTTVSGITDVDPTKLTNVFIFKERLWFIEKESLYAWYLPVNSISGVAEAINCGALFARGGKLIAGINWSVDAGEGKDDLLALISSEGEMLIFAGTDPSDASAWDFVGNYYVGKPLSHRCFFKVGGDVLVLSQEGVLPISKAVSLDKAVFSRNSLTKQFHPDYAAAVQRYHGNFGWEMVALPTANMALLNVPIAENGEAEQFIWNTSTGSPSKFSGWWASCWALFDNEIYFGARYGTVYKAWVGANDDGYPYTAYLLSAYNDLKSPATTKHIKLARALFETNVLIAPDVAIAADYAAPGDYSTIDVAANTGFFTWDVSAWDEAEWLGTQVFRPWFSGHALGTAIAPATRVVMDGGASEDLHYRLFAHHVIYEDGGMVG